MNFNQVTLMGRLTQEPELRYFPNGTPKCELRLVTNRTFEDRRGEKQREVLFVDVVFWGRRGEVVKQYFSKGRPIFIQGRLCYDEWEDGAGRKRSKHYVTADLFEFVNSAPGNGSSKPEEPGF